MKKLRKLQLKVQKIPKKTPQNPQSPKTTQENPSQESDFPSPSLKISQTPQENPPLEIANGQKNPLDVSEKPPFEVSNKSCLSEKSPFLCRKSPVDCEKVSKSPQNVNDIQIEKSKFRLKSPKLKLSMCKKSQIEEPPRPIWSQKSPKLKLSMWKKSQIEEPPRHIWSQKSSNLKLEMYKKSQVIKSQIEEIPRENGHKSPSVVNICPTPVPNAPNISKTQRKSTKSLKSEKSLKSRKIQKITDYPGFKSDISCHENFTQKVVQTHTQTHTHDISVPSCKDAQKPLCWSALVTGESQFHQPTKSDCFDDEKFFIGDKIDHLGGVQHNVNGDTEHECDKNLDVAPSKSSTRNVMQRHLHVAKGNIFEKQIRGSAKSELDTVLEKRFDLVERGGPFSKKAISKMGILEPKFKQKLKKTNTPKSK